MLDAFFYALKDEVLPILGVLVAVAIPIGLAIGWRRVLRRSARSRGLVLEAAQRTLRNRTGPKPRGSRIVHEATFQFDADEITHTISCEYSPPPELKAGSQIDVLYDPENPGNARPDEGPGKYTEMIFLSALGAFATIALLWNVLKP